MSDDVQIALIVAVPATLAALGSVLASILTARRSDRKLDTISSMTNGTLTRALDRIEYLSKEIASLKQTAQRKRASRKGARRARGTA